MLTAVNVSLGPFPKKNYPVLTFEIVGIELLRTGGRRLGSSLLLTSVSHVAILGFFLKQVNSGQ